MGRGCFDCDFWGLGGEEGPFDFLVLRQAQHEEECETSAFPVILILSLSKDQDASRLEGKRVELRTASLRGASRRSNLGEHQLRSVSVYWVASLRSQ